MKTIFEPIKIGMTEFKNRLVVAAMVTNYCTRDGMATEKYIAYHEARARGGWGIIITENHGVTPYAGSYPTVAGLWSDAHITSHADLTARVHEAGGKIIAQIYHAGRATNSKTTGVQSIAPSPLKDPLQNEVPREMSAEEIIEMVELFGNAALRAKKAGFDGVELNGGHGYLIAQFLSPFSNKRSDAYGGAIAGRAKFAVDIVKNIRGKVGAGFPIFFRMSTVECVDGGLEIAESRVIAQLLERAGVDLLHCSQGAPATREVIIPPFEIPHGYFINNAAEIKKAVHIPVIAVGRIVDTLMAEEILISGKADLVTMARASLADPEMPNKVMSNQQEDILYCIGCLQGCVGENRKGRSIRCLVNPFTGMENEYILQPSEVKKKVLIAGGGVAGCEAAIIAALRGHEVTLFEKEGQLGGQWRAASVPINKSEFNTFIIWQKNQLKKLGVKVELNVELTRSMIDAQHPDVVIIATGSRPFLPPIKGIETANPVTANDVLLGRASVGQNVVIIGGGQVGAETAHHLAVHGSQVTLVEMLPQIMQDGEPIPVKLLKKRLNQNHVKVMTGTQVTEVNSNKVFVLREGQEMILDNTDTLVIAIGSSPSRELEHSMQDSNIEWMLVGDALGVKEGFLNIQEGFQAGFRI